MEKRSFKRRIVALLMAAIMVITAFPVMVAADVADSQLNVFSYVMGVGTSDVQDVVAVAFDVTGVSSPITATQQAVLTIASGAVNEAFSTYRASNTTTYEALWLMMVEAATDAILDAYDAGEIEDEHLDIFAYDLWFIIEIFEMVKACYDYEGFVSARAFVGFELGVALGNRFGDFWGIWEQIPQSTPLVWSISRLGTDPTDDPTVPTDDPTAPITPPVYPVPPVFTPGSSVSDSAPIPQSTSSDLVMAAITVAGTSADVRIVANRATVQLDTDAIDSIVDAGDVAEFDLSGLDVVSAGLPRNALRAFAAEGMSLEVILPQGAIALDADALADLASSVHTSNVIFRINEVATTQLPESFVARIPVGATIHQVNISAGSRSFRNLDGAMAVALPASASDEVFALGTSGARQVGAGVVVGNANVLVALDAEFIGSYLIFDVDALGLFIVG